MCAEARLKSGTGSLAPEYDNLSAVIATGVHLFPFRTEKLSPPAPMVLGARAPGRVGRRRIFFLGRKSHETSGRFRFRRYGETHALGRPRGAAAASRRAGP